MILKFNEFINESYLKSGRHLLYHYTSRLNTIMESDMLKISKPAEGDECICFTRSSYFEEHAKTVRLVLESDLLKRDGYKTYPVDELAMASSGENLLKGYTKSNPYFPGRKTIHNINLNQDLDGFYGGLEWEYEERSYKNIKNLGKYIIAIDITKEQLNRNYKDLKEYLDKYPHIEIYELNMEKLYDRRNKINFEEIYKEISAKYNQPSKIFSY